MTPVESSVAVLVVRDGVPPLGGDEAVAEAGGAAVLVGSGSEQAAAELTTLRTGWLAEQDDVGPATLSARLADVLAACQRIVLPASPDGRDLAPRLAAELDRPLLAGALSIGAHGATVIRWGGLACVDLTVAGPFVATLQPGLRGVVPVGDSPTLAEISLPHKESVPDPTVLEVLAADPGTVDLAEAARIFTAGAGLGRGDLDGPDAVRLLGEVAAALGASVGATRVVTDAGWTGYQRQIGTTGVLVDPDLYVAFGVSGASQHLGGLGDPAHVVSVNTDPHCPMTALADLGIVADAAAVLRELAGKLGVADE